MCFMETVCLSFFSQFFLQIQYYRTNHPRLLQDGEMKSSSNSDASSPQPRTSSSRNVSQSSETVVSWTVRGYGIFVLIYAAEC